MSRLLPLFVFLALLALLAFGIYWNQHHEMNEVPSPLIGKPAPEFNLPQLDDPSQLVSRTSLLGQVYLLNVFASWCIACQEEHPVLNTYAKQLGIKLIGYNYKDTPDDAKRWLAQFGNPYSTVITDESGRVAIDFGVYGAPETFLIDTKGIIRYKHIGPLSPDAIAHELKPHLEALQRGEQ